MEIDRRIEDNLVAAFAAALRDAYPGDEWNREWETADRSKLNHPDHVAAFDELIRVFNERKDLATRERRIEAMHRACVELRRLARRGIK